MGSGSLLLNAKKYADKPKYIKYYGQELNTSTYNLARMNMFLHGIAAENQKLRNGDTLDGDWPTGEETDFDMVLMNPPYSAKWSAAAGLLVAILLAYKDKGLLTVALGATAAVFVVEQGMALAGLPL